jgi:hypothetical protein
LTNVIVEHPERGIKIFDLAGTDPLTGRRFALHLEMPLDATLCDFLLLVMRCPDAPVVMRFACAKNAAVLTHPKPKRVAALTVSDEQKRERQHARHRANALDPTPVSNIGPERLSSLVAVAEAEPGVSDG